MVVTAVLAFGRAVREGKESPSSACRPSPDAKDQLAPHLDALIRLLQDETGFRAWVPIQDVSAPQRLDLGPILVARQLVSPSTLGTILDGSVPLRRHAKLLSETHFPVAGESSHSSWQ